MVDIRAERLDRILNALSDSTRRAMLSQLAVRECSVSELAAPHAQTLAGVSKHLKVLERAELVKKTRHGRVITCSARLEPLSEVYALLESLGAFWRGRLDALEEFMEQHPNDKETTDGSRRKRNRESKGRRKKGSTR